MHSSMELLKKVFKDSLYCAKTYLDSRPHSDLLTIKSTLSYTVLESHRSVSWHGSVIITGQRSAQILEFCRGE